MRCSAAAEMARAFSLKVRFKAVDATDLGSESAYRIGVHSRKNMQNLAQKLAPSPVPRQKGYMGWSKETLLRGREMGFS